MPKKAGISTMSSDDDDSSEESDVDADGDIKARSHLTRIAPSPHVLAVSSFCSSSLPDPDVSRNATVCFTPVCRRATPPCPPSPCARALAS